MLPVGLHHNIPFADYQADPGVNFSTLKHMAKSPRHYKHAVDAGLGESTPAQVVGAALHCAILEPARFETTYVREPNFGDLRTKIAKDEREHWRAQNVGRIWLADADHTRVTAMAGAVLADRELAARIVQCATEVTVIWNDLRTGLRCKARIDALRPDGDVYEVKTTADATPRRFFLSAARYLYHAQRAHYLAGLHTITGKHHDWHTIVVENVAPFDSYVVDADPAVTFAGGVMVEQWLTDVATCRKIDHWGGIGRGGVSEDYPAWSTPDDGEPTLNGEAT